MDNTYFIDLPYRTTLEVVDFSSAESLMVLTEIDKKCLLIYVLKMRTTLLASVYETVL